MKTIQLTTRGRKTGKPHERELYAFEHKGKLVITASAGGSDNHPDWYLNLRADPHVHVRIGREEFEATAQQTSPALRQELWAELIRQAPMYDSYRKKTKRVIPMVLLTLQNK